METKFDPMTGEVIQTESQPQYDPTTGQPVRQNYGQQAQYDPMTGQPVGQQAQYDPMTGQPVGQQAQYDPMTGQPVGQQPYYSAPPQSTAKKSAFGKVLVIAAVAVVAVAVIGVVTVKAAPRIVLGKNYKIVQAVENTIEGNHLLENLNVSDIVNDGKYSIAAAGEVENVEVDVTLAYDLPAKEISLQGSGSYDGFRVEGAMMVDDRQILMSVPALTDKTLAYTYAGNNDGYLTELLEYQGYDTDKLDEAMQNMFEQGDTSEVADALKKASIKAIKRMDFKKSNKRDVKIDGSNRSCQGYMITIDEDLMLDLCDIYEDELEDYLDSLKSIGDLTGEDDLEDAIDNIRDSVKGMDDFDMTIYLYKKQVAAVLLESGRNELALELHGGSYAWENVTLEYNDEEVMELSGNVKGKVETMTLDMYGREILSYEYNFGTGDIELSAGDGYYELEGSLEKTRHSLTCRISRISAYGSSVDVEGVVTITDEVKHPKIGKDKVIDLGNASQDELYDLVEDLQDMW